MLDVDERRLLALAIGASVMVHASAFLLPAWRHLDAVEPPVPLRVELLGAREAPTQIPTKAPAQAPAEPPTRLPPEARAQVPDKAPASPELRPQPPPAPARRAEAAPRAVVPRQEPAPASPASASSARQPPAASDQPAGAASPAPPAAPSPAERADAPAPAPPAVAAAARTTSPSYGAAYLRNPPPRYPADARRNGTEGTVTLRVWVAADGTAGRVELDRSSGSRSLDDAATSTVKTWRFVPAHRNGEPVEAWVTVPLVFRLDAGN